MHEVMPHVHTVSSRFLAAQAVVVRYAPKEVFNNSISTTTSMNSRFDSTAAAQVHAGYSFTDSLSRPLPLF